jgi:hypothetical protein
LSGSFMSGSGSLIGTSFANYLVAVTPPHPT